MGFEFPDRPPIDEPGAMLRLQAFLLSEAEKRLGPRATQVPILPPAFNSDGPRTIITLKGVAAELSDNARLFWPTVVYELSHECVHLLDDPRSVAPMIEEGCAVLFSLDAQFLLYGQPIERPTAGSYARALTLVAHLPGLYAVPKALRAALGSLARTTPEVLLALAPGLDPHMAIELCERRAMR